MDSKRLKTLINGLGHPSGSDLLMYTDGELPAGKAAKIRRHLNACWQCRVELQQISQAIQQFMECRDAEIAQTPPLRGWSQFSRLLSSAAAEPEEPRPFWSILGRPQQLKFAAVGIAVAAIVLGLYLRPIPTVSANSLLELAENAEFRPEKGTKDRVVYQRIAFRRKPSLRELGQAGEIETWRDLDRAQYRQRSNAPLWPELEQVLNRTQMGRRQLLSATAFRAWRDSLTGRQESVHNTRQADGTETLTLTVQSEARQPDFISEASLVVRAGDWRPVQESLRSKQSRVFKSSN